MRGGINLEATVVEHNRQRQRPFIAQTNKQVRSDGSTTKHGSFCAWAEACECNRMLSVQRSVEQMAEVTHLSARRHTHPEHCRPGTQIPQVRRAASANVSDT